MSSVESTGAKFLTSSSVTNPSESVRMGLCPGSQLNEKPDIWQSLPRLRTAGLFSSTSALVVMFKGSIEICTPRSGRMMPFAVDRSGAPQSWYVRSSRTSIGRCRLDTMWCPEPESTMKLALSSCIWGLTAGKRLLAFHRSEGAHV